MTHFNDIKDCEYADDRNYFCEICSKTLVSKCLPGRESIILILDDTCITFDCGHIFHSQCHQEYLKHASLMNTSIQCIACNTPIQKQIYVWDFFKNPSIELYEHFKNNKIALNYCNVFFKIALRLLVRIRENQLKLNDRINNDIKLFELMLENDLVCKMVDTLDILGVVDTKTFQSSDAFITHMFNVLCILYKADKSLYESLSVKFCKVYPIMSNMLASHINSIEYENEVNKKGFCLFD